MLQTQTSTISITDLDNKRDYTNYDHGLDKSYIQYIHLGSSYRSTLVISIICASIIYGNKKIIFGIFYWKQLATQFVCFGPLSFFCPRLLMSKEHRTKIVISRVPHAGKSQFATGSFES